MPLTDLEKTLQEFENHEPAVMALTYSKDAGPKAAQVMALGIYETYDRKGISRDDPAMDSFYREVALAVKGGKPTTSMAKVAAYNTAKYETAKQNVSIENIVKQAEKYGLKLKNEDKEIINKYASKAYKELKESAYELDEKGKVKEDDEGNPKVKDEEAARVITVIDSVIETYKINAGLLASLMAKQAELDAEGILRPPKEDSA